MKFSAGCRNPQSMINFCFRLTVPVNMKNTSFFFLLMIFQLGTVSGSFSAEEFQVYITWDDCIREAAGNNPDLLAARMEVAQSEAEKRIATAGLLPQVSADASTSTSKSSGEDRGESFSYGLVGRQLIFDGLKSWYDLDQSKQALNATRQRYELTSRDIRRSLREAFISLLKSQELVGISENIAARRRKQAGLVELRYKGGREHKGALLTALANLSQAEYDITRARRDVKVAREQLCKELGREGSDPFRAKGELTTFARHHQEPDFDQLVQEHPAVLELTARKEERYYELNSSYSAFSPEIYGSAGIYRNDSDWPPQDENWSLSLSVSLPLFKGGSRIDEVSKARAALSGAEEEERSGRNEVLLDLREAWINLEDAEELVSIRKQFQEAGEERAKIAEAQYSTGMLSFDNWIIIEDDLVNSQKRYLEARAEAMRAEAQWVYARGGTLEE